MATASLVRLFLRDLVRRRSLWILIVACAAVLAVGGLASELYLDVLEDSDRYDLATQQVQGALEGWAEWIELAFFYAMFVFAAFVAPESRRNGTTQYLLSVPVSRRRIAACQFMSLSLIMWIGGLILHGGFAAVAVRYEAMSAPQIAFGWAFLVLPAWMATIVPFAFSLRFSTVGTLILVFLLPVAVAWTPTFLSVEWHPAVGTLKHLLEELSLLTPRFLDELRLWPRVPGDLVAPRLPEASFLWVGVHSAMVLAFWLTLAAWLYRHYDFGSRTAVK